MDSSGNLYGTTFGGGASGYGTVFELSPAASGTWTEKFLYSFKGGSYDGLFPFAGLIMDSSGNLYGTTQGGGASGWGTVFELSPRGTWNETILYSFSGGNDGATPAAGLIMDSNGNLYGTTVEGGASRNGTVFELSPPTTADGPWNETVLHAFKGGNDGAAPYAGLIMDSSGNLYGTTGGGGASGWGTVFELSPPTFGPLSRPWNETVLYAFKGGNDGVDPLGGLIMDSQGNLYGTTSGGRALGYGTVFELIQIPGVPGAWNETILYAFSGGNDGANPGAGLVMAQGNLYGTTAGGGASGYGTVFELTSRPGWTETVLHAFSGGDGATPNAGLTTDSKGYFYGTTFGGGPTVSAGTVFGLRVIPTPVVCSNCRSPAICCACAGGIWNGKQCS
jgi:uncharacterized repeat protein (TIGR03803 family)